MRQTAFSASMAQQMAQQITAPAQELAKNLFERKKLAVLQEEKQHDRQIDYLKMALAERRANSSMQNDTVRAAASMLRAVKPTATRTASGKSSVYDGLSWPSDAGVVAPAPAPVDPGTAGPDPIPGGVPSPESGSSLPLPTQGGPNPILPPAPPDTVIEGEGDGTPTEATPTNVAPVAPAQTGNTPTGVIDPTAPADYTNIGNQEPVLSPSAGVVLPSTPDERLASLKQRLGPDLYNVMNAQAISRVNTTAESKQEYFDEAARFGPGARPYFDMMWEALEEKAIAREKAANAEKAATDLKADRAKSNRSQRIEFSNDVANAEALIESKYPVGDKARDAALGALNQFKSRGVPFLPTFNTVITDIDAQYKTPPAKAQTADELVKIGDYLDNLQRDKSLTEEEKADIREKRSRINERIKAMAEEKANIAPAIPGPNPKPAPATKPAPPKNPYDPYLE
jgi:hypothetical protein